MENSNLFALSLGIAAGIGVVGYYQDEGHRAIEQKLEQFNHELYVTNVVGNNEPDKFYKINGKRIFLEIDGKPVEEYFRK